VELHWVDDRSEVLVHLPDRQYLLGPYDVLARFLHEVGVESIMLDADLEWNQVQDVLEYLWSTRHYLGEKRQSWLDRLFGRKNLAVALCSPQGVHLSCAEVRLRRDDRELDIANSYCPLIFSRAVTTYKSKVSEFRDHRAFFRAAPRYALFVVLVVLLPVLAMWLWQDQPLPAVVAAIMAAALLGTATLIVLQTIGAVEYDKEHQAQELRRRHSALSQAHQAITRDLERARRIQRMLIPDKDAQPLPEHCRMAYRFVPEMAVGGDYYDVRPRGDDELAVLLADVSGHGMSGAFVTGLIKTAFDLAYDPDQPPHYFVELVNRLLDDNTPEDSFAAMIFLVYNARHRSLRYVVAGHAPEPFLVHPDGSLEMLNGSGGMIAGVDPETRYVHEQVEPAQGDLLVLCTDGITDAANALGEFFGVEALKDLLRANAGRSADEVVQAIDEALAEHTGREAQTDDQTVIVMEIT
jgi:serine phosphatase RsbU (regulator of sigma subunit)